MLERRFSPHFYPTQEKNGEHQKARAELANLRQTTRIAANAFQGFGGYYQRTGINCVAASLRETERKLAKAGIRCYQFLPGIRVEDRIPEVLLRICGNLTISD